MKPNVTTTDPISRALYLRYLLAPADSLPPGEGEEEHLEPGGGCLGRGERLRHRDGGRHQ